MSEALWPYLLIVLAGVLPNEIFRVAGVLIGKRVDDSSEIFVWIRIVAIALLAAVVGKIVFTPPGALAAYPRAISLVGIAIGIGVYFATKRRIVPAILCGEAAFVGLAFWFS